MKTLNFSTALQFFDYGLERQVRLRNPIFEGGQVLGVFCKAVPDRFIDQIGQGALRFRCLQPKCPMQSRIEVNRRPFLLLFHGRKIAL